jgi:cation diffusion facilitator CzcD-associated flavoprotein CzcO
MKTVSKAHMPQEGAPARQRDVVVVGAGSYGLSTAAYLQEQRLKLAVIGKPLHLWWGHMTEGTLLRSFWWATHPPTCTARRWIGAIMSRLPHLMRLSLPA